jgi:hypothetical protein
MVPPQLYLFLIFLPAAHMLDRFSIHGLAADIPLTTPRLARLSGPQKRRLSKLNIAASILVSRSSLQKHFH